MVQIFNSQFNDDVPGVPRPPEHRDENLRLMDSLFFLAGENHLGIMKFQQTFDGQWYVVYLDLSRWEEPSPAKTKFEELLDMDDLIHRCSLPSKLYLKFEDLVIGEIERLKAKL